MDFHSHSIRAEHFDFNFQFDDNEYTPRGIGCQQCLHNAVDKFKEYVNRIITPKREPSPITPPTSHKRLNTSMESLSVMPVSKRAKAEHPRIINLKSTESIVIEDSNDSEYSSISTYKLANNETKELSPAKQSTIKPEPQLIQSPIKSQTKTTLRCSICHKQLEESAIAFKPAITKPQVFQQQCTHIFCKECFEATSTIRNDNQCAWDGYPMIAKEYRKRTNPQLIYTCELCKMGI